MKYNDYSKNKHCECGELITNKSKRCQKCANKKSIKIRIKNRRSYEGISNPNSKNGTKIEKGYIYIYMPKHPNADKRHYIKRANLVMDKKLDRYLKKGEVVHHKNSIRDDDRPENLKLFSSNGEHTKFEEQKRNKKTGRYELKGVK